MVIDTTLAAATYTFAVQGGSNIGPFTLRVDYPAPTTPILATRPLRPATPVAAGLLVLGVLLVLAPPRRRWSTLTPHQ
jgi:hypothetical protein